MVNKEIIAVDLDGTLVKTDVLIESILLLLKKDVVMFVRIPLWFMRKGRAYTKAKIADMVMPNVSNLPYFAPVLDFLRKKKAEGACLILASASDHRIVRSVAEHVGIFDHSLGTSPERNLKGKEKLATLQEYCNGAQFSYVGDSRADIPIWQASRDAYIVAQSKGLEKKINMPRERVHFFNFHYTVSSIFKSLRIYQWSKNLLLFIPVFLAHQFLDFSRISSCIIAFVLFGICASSLYIINDIFDIEADRLHPTKRNRPFAAGTLPISFGILLSVSGLVLSFWLSYLLVNTQFLLILLLYTATTLLYSFFFKKFSIIDVLVLSGFYALRIFAGGTAGSVEVSPWMLIFSIFFFLNLAFMKRFIEINEYADINVQKLNGRKYESSDNFFIETAGISSGFMSVLLFYLYLNQSSEVKTLYTKPLILWFIGPLLIYWFMRRWFLAQRGMLKKDPVLFAITDRTSWLVCVLITGIIVAGYLL